MKIAILHDNFPPRSVGGGDIIAFITAQELQKRGHEVIVITTSRDAKDAGVSTYEGLRVHTIATAYNLRFQAYVGLWNIPAARQVETILRDWKPDVIHAHNVHGYLSYRTLVIGKKLGARVVLTCHDVMAFNYAKLTSFIDPDNLSIPTTFDYRASAWQQFTMFRIGYNPLRNIIIRRVLKNSVDCILPVSDALRQALADNEIAATGVVHNGIDATEWQEPRETVEAFKKKHGLGGSAVLFGGRISGLKGSGKLLEALAIVARTIPDVQLLVVGRKDNIAERMLAEAAKVGLSGKIIFTGWISGHELHRAYYASALVAVPSLCFDAFPTMNLEAMACAKPVVATCFGGSREAVIDGTTGFIVNPYDVPALAGRIAELLADKEKSVRFGQAGHERVTAEFTIKKQVDQFEEYYRKK